MISAAAFTNVLIGISLKHENNSSGKSKNALSHFALEQ